MLTPKRLAAALRDMPPSTTAPTTRSRRSSESAISAASFARRQSSSRSKAIRESLPRFNSLGDRSSDPKDAVVGGELLDALGEGYRQRAAIGHVPGVLDRERVGRRIDARDH